MENAYKLIADQLSVPKDATVAVVDIGATMTTLIVLQATSAPSTPASRCSAASSSPTR